MTDITELTSVQKNANIHRLSRLIAYASNDELRQMAVEVEHYTDQLIEALEKAQAENTAGVAGMAESYETTISMLRSRIAELESRTVTVKLPQAVSAGGQGYQEQVEWILTAAGIKVEAE
ncbi:hypothetical protein DJ518_07895 [Klebsiella pneumoniae]|uniref:hypothetical protein n=1 Tax=Klebsiella pneumoniae TaxID=573 RepID=UPI0011E4B65F|nr:hypothetical protein [Klebsiella pneumoniae]TYE03137.1 hypothetical protein DJ518_07895 [Klebsiella pneumoniae]